MSLTVSGVHRIPVNILFQNDLKIVHLKGFLGDDSYYNSVYQGYKW